MNFKSLIFTLILYFIGVNSYAFDGYVGTGLSTQGHFYALNVSSLDVLHTKGIFDSRLASSTSIGWRGLSLQTSISTFVLGLKGSIEEYHSNKDIGKRYITVAPKVEYLQKYVTSTGFTFLVNFGIEPGNLSLREDSGKLTKQEDFLLFKKETVYLLGLGIPFSIGD